jgi:hypothetical protein
MKVTFCIGGQVAGRRGALTVIVSAPLRTVRPVMLEGVYANPRKELVRMRDAGRLVQIAPGTYTAKPDDVAVDRPWRPLFEEAAMAYATAQYADRVPVLYGIGAARFHGAIPRAIAVTVIAVPQQHRPVRLTDGGRIVFTTTDVDRLTARLEHGKIGDFLVTTPEQTYLDLLERPALGGMPAEAAAAVRALVGRIDRDKTLELMGGRTQALQRKAGEQLGLPGGRR